MGSCNGVPARTAGMPQRRPEATRETRDASIQCTYVKNIVNLQTDSTRQHADKRQPPLDNEKIGLGAAQLAKMIQLAHRQKRMQSPRREVLIANQLQWLKQESELDLKAFIKKKNGKTINVGMSAINTESERHNQSLDSYAKNRRHISIPVRLEHKLNLKLECQSTPIFKVSHDGEGDTRKPPECNLSLISGGPEPDDNPELDATQKIKTKRNSFESQVRIADDSRLVASATIAKRSSNIRISMRKCSLERKVTNQFKDHFKDINYNSVMPRINSVLLEGTILETSQSLQLFNTLGLHRSDSAKLDGNLDQNKGQGSCQSETGNSRILLNSPPQFFSRGSIHNQPRILFPFVIKGNKKTPRSLAKRNTRSKCLLKAQTPFVLIISIFVNGKLYCSKEVPILKSRRIIKNVD